MRKKYKISLFFLLSVYFCVGQNSEQRETISKLYDVNGRSLKIVNSFGEIQLTNWDKDQIQIDVEIISKANNNDKAQRILDKIDIEVKENSQQITYLSKVDDINSKNNESFEIKYQIKLPATLSLELNQTFGDILISSRKGDADIHVAYGNLKAVDFLNLKLNLSFGSGALMIADKAEIEISYSSFEIEAVEKLTLVEKFSDIKIEEVKNLDLRCNYGEIKIDKIGTAEVDAQFTGLKIGTLENSLMLKSNYVSGFEIRMLKKDFEFVDISSKFSELEINLENGLRANFEGEFSFANLKDYVGINYSLKAKDHNDSEYRGTINGGDSNKKIIIESSYGDLKVK